MKLEKRKIKEIEHSRLRRSILQGFERVSDTNTNESPENLDNLISNKELFKKHFSNMKFYSITKLSEDFKWNWLKKRCKKDVRVLDFGCGNGENGIFAAQCGSNVTGIDISPEGVENANLNAKKFKLDQHCKFLVMDGEKMSFPENTFDLAVEYGVLHHVDLDKAMSELSRVLKPEGEMICIEALRHNPLIHLYRRMTPHLRTKWEFEHILSVDDLNVVKKHFGKVEVNFFHLTSLLAVPFRKTPIFCALRKFLDKIDKKILGNKFLGKYGWIMIFTISRPIKKR
jgi:ubiquinone/menaquinone biosynthesis C-methylase UbiE